MAYENSCQPPLRVNPASLDGRRKFITGRGAPPNRLQIGGCAIKSARAVREGTPSRGIDDL